MNIRILIADDHGVLRAGLRALLNAEEEIEVVGEAADGVEAVRLVETLKPDIVLMDISMPGMNGLEATRLIRERAPDTRVLILSVHEDETLLQEAIRAGAAGYIIKRAVELELLSAIRAVWRGDIYVHPSLTGALLRGLNLGASTSPHATDSSIDRLTPREKEVLRLIALGYTNQQIADELHISVRTVETHRANITSKLGMRSRARLVRYAREHGLID
ncbi:MAG: DNA-binding response regulator [Ardenticatenia bacterium]|nr:MAG: DNA-binding response regulator [Ardenticatenia bacterium]